MAVNTHTEPKCKAGQEPMRQKFVSRIRGDGGVGGCSGESIELTKKKNHNQLYDPLGLAFLGRLSEKMRIKYVTPNQSQNAQPPSLRTSCRAS